MNKIHNILFLVLFSFSSVAMEEDDINDMDDNICAGAQLFDKEGEQIEIADKHINQMSVNEESLALVKEIIGLLPEAFVCLDRGTITDYFDECFKFLEAENPDDDTFARAKSIETYLNDMIKCIPKDVNMTDDILYDMLLFIKKNSDDKPIVIYDWRHSIKEMLSFAETNDKEAVDKIKNSLAPNYKANFQETMEIEYKKDNIVKKIKDDEISRSCYLRLLSEALSEIRSPDRIEFSKKDDILSIMKYYFEGDNTQIYDDSNIISTTLTQIKSRTHPVKDTFFANHTFILDEIQECLSNIINSIGKNHLGEVDNTCKHLEHRMTKIISEIEDLKKKEGYEEKTRRYKDLEDARRIITVHKKEQDKFFKALKELSENNSGLVRQPYLTRCEKNMIYSITEIENYVTSLHNKLEEQMHNLHNLN